MRSPEERLLVACAALQLDARARGDVEALLAGNLDWPSVLREADRHGLRPLLHRHLGALPRHLVPKPVLVDLWAGYERGLRRNREMARELSRIVDALEAQGIAALPYKGPTLACAVYGDVGLREFGDLDILLRPADMMAAVRLLQSMGYGAEYPLSPAATEGVLRSGLHYHLLYRGAAGIVVELHWRSDPDYPVEGMGDAWWQALPQPYFEERRVRAFTPDDLFFVLCLHGSKHRWASLGWLVDISQMLRANTVVDAGNIAARAREMGVERRLYLGLRLARDLLDAPVPGALQAGCGRDEIGALAAQVSDEIFAPRDRGAFARLRRDLALYDRRSHQLRHAIQAIAAPSLVEWSRWKLPRALFFLYPAIRLARLAARPLTRFRRTPPAATPRTPPPQPRSTG